MIIQSSNVAMQGSSSYLSSQKLEVSQVVRLKPIDLRLHALSRNNALKARQQEIMERSNQNGDSLSVSDQGAALSKSLEAGRTGQNGVFPSGDWLEETKRMLIQSLLEQLGMDEGYGTERLREKLQNRLDKLNERYNASRTNDFTPHKAVFGPERMRILRPLTGNVLVSRSSSEVYIENSMSFSAQASVKTADGRDINIDINLNMSQSYYEKVETQLTAIFKDPLVINLNASSAQLSDVKFEFDLDCDGQSDQISRLMSGSGFLALDKNGDGVINDGGELFGAKTGDGFAELAAYDKDGNGWIDEADDIFDKLRVWTHNEDGTSSLIGLGQAGVGAIFLGNVGTDYALGSLANPDGMIRSTGMFLFENGGAGTIQHVDLAI